MEVGDKIIAPKGCANYLTPGKEYKVREKLGTNFSVIDDDGDKILISEKQSTHLRGQDWIIPTEQPQYHSGKITGFMTGVVVGGLIGLTIGVVIGLIF
jgi:hypothetical protein